MTRRALIAAAASALVLVPLGVLWQQSLRPDAYSVMNMGTVDLGGGPDIEHAHHGVPVTKLIGDPARKADVRVEFVAKQDGDRYTLNGSTPGPEIRVRAGQMLEVEFTNRNVTDGTTLHWHGVDLPNGEDGVAGVTQDAVLPGKTHTYRFVAEDPGTYWYHSHQVSHEQVQKGLFGALVVEGEALTKTETVALAHTYAGKRTLNGKAGDLRVPGPVGPHLLRVINTDNGALPVWSDMPFWVVAVDARAVNGPTPVEDQSISVPAGGRVDLIVEYPSRIQIGSATAVIVGDGTPPKPEQPKKQLDLLAYGKPAKLPFDVSDPDREFRYDIGRRPGFLDGRPGFWWTVNGKMGDDVPMFMVDEGDIVTMTITNNSSEVHPMHLHGHHAVVLSRNGKKATGTPWWTDSLNVDTDETYEIAFVADNPGIWMDHCHNLPHAKEGLIAHLMYAGVTTPYKIGGTSQNEPE